MGLTGKIAFVFPGQGSQQVGMGKDLFESEPLAKELFEKANAALGFNLAEICFSGPEEELKKTAITQPAILTVSIILNSLLTQKGITPELTAGHSLGEYSALVAVGALQFEDAVKLVHHRGKFMQEAVPLGKGAMSAILGAKRDQVIAICKEISTGAAFVGPANFNSLDQIVISGDKKAVEMAGEKLTAAGAKKVIPLPVSAPFHSVLMKPAEDKLARELARTEITSLKVPVISNVSAKPVRSAVEYKELLIKQLTSPVLWVDSVQEMLNSGIDTFVEVGPGKVLAGLIKKINRQVNIYNVSNLKSLRELT